MPSLKMKSKVSMSILRERKDLRVCPKSNIISKKPCPKIISAQVAELDNNIQSCLAAASRTQVSSKDTESGESIDNKVNMDKINSEFQQQQSFFDGSSALAVMETSNPCTANLETRFSPAFDPVEVYNQSHAGNHAGRINDDFHMPGLGADEGDNGRIICGYETCDVSDFYISDMMITSLPLDGDAFDDDTSETDCTSDYKSAEQGVLYDAADPYMVLPALEDAVKTDSNSDIKSCEEVMMLQENASLYAAMAQIRSCNLETDGKNGLVKEESFDPQLFIKNLPELSHVESNGQRMAAPDENQRRKSVTLVLDLDETLVHSTLEHCEDADFTFNVFFNMKDYTVYVKQRPYLYTFLEKVAEMFEVVIFTASQSIYAKQLLDILDPDGKFISHRVYRESCIFLDGNYTKDLTVLGVDLARVAIIDNSPQVFRLQVNNGIPITSWFDDPLDSALMSLLPFLETLADADDVRPIIAKRFGNKE